MLFPPARFSPLHPPFRASPLQEGIRQGGKPSWGATARRPLRRGWRLVAFSGAKTRRPQALPRAAALRVAGCHSAALPPLRRRPPLGRARWSGTARGSGCRHRAAPSWCSLRSPGHGEAPPRAFVEARAAAVRAALRLPSLAVAATRLRGRFLRTTDGEIQTPRQTPAHRPDPDPEPDADASRGSAPDGGHTSARLSPSAHGARAAPAVGYAAPLSRRLLAVADKTAYAYGFGGSGSALLPEAGRKWGFGKAMRMFREARPAPTVHADARPGRPRYMAPHEAHGGDAAQDDADGERGGDPRDGRALALRAARPGEGGKGIPRTPCQKGQPTVFHFPQAEPFAFPRGRPRRRSGRSAIRRRRPGRRRSPGTGPAASLSAGALRSSAGPVAGPASRSPRRRTARRLRRARLRRWRCRAHAPRPTRKALRARVRVSNPWKIGPRNLPMPGNRPCGGPCPENDRPVCPRIGEGGAARVFLSPGCRTSGTAPATPLHTPCRLSAGPRRRLRGLAAPVARSAIRRRRPGRRRSPGPGPASSLSAGRRYALPPARSPVLLPDPHGDGHRAGYAVRGRGAGASRLRAQATPAHGGRGARASGGKGASEDRTADGKRRRQTETDARGRGGRRQSTAAHRPARLFR